jgi:peptide/nickel transport system permease protein
VGRYIIHRLITLVPIMIGISILVFLILHLVPGDPVLNMLGTDATDENIKALTAQLGLDKPLPLQYLHWMGGLFVGDFGKSIVSGHAIFPELISRFGVTLQLAVLASIIGWLIAIPIGMLSAVKAHSTLDISGRIFAMLGVSVPNFVIGTLLLLFFSLVMNWFPPLQFINIWENPAESLRKLALPAVTVGIVLAAGVMRMTRSAFLETLDKDFIRTARAKGNAERHVLFSHALKNSAIPIITLAGMQFGYLLGGSVIVEQLFSIPGIGQYILDGIYRRDYPVVQGGVLFVAFVFVIINLLVDIIYSKIDPRIKY